MLDDDWDILSLYLLGVSAVAALVAVFFYYREPLRPWRHRSTIEWTGKGFDPGVVATRLAHVRQDYVGALHARPLSRFHAALIECAANMVRNRAYWRQPVPDHPEQETTDQRKA